MKKNMLYLMMASVLLLATGCDQAQNGSEILKPAVDDILTGKTDIRITLPGGSRGITYYELSDVSRYEITVVYNGETFASRTGAPGDTVTVSVTDSGYYDISVRAYNEDDTLVGSGSADVYVSLEEDIVNVTVTVYPEVKSTTGASLCITVSWYTPPTTTTTIAANLNYTVTFDANGGTGSMDAQTMRTGVQYQLSANTFTRDDYVFIGWNTSPDATSVLYRDGVYIKDLPEDADHLSVTLYAVWYQTIICYSDGTYSASIDTDKTPVGIAIATDSDGRPTKMLHLKQQYGLQWCIAQANAYGMYLNTSESDGSGNWGIISSAVPDYDIEGHYPAFEYVNGLTEYGGSWYIPAIDELESIYTIKDPVNVTIERLQNVGFDADTLSGYIWSASAYGYNHAWGFSFDGGDRDYNGRNDDGNVRAIRAF